MDFNEYLKTAKNLNYKYYKNQSKDKFILSDFYEDVKNKNKKNLLPNQIQKYISAINNGIDVLNRGDLYNNFYNKFFVENYSRNRNHAPSHIKKDKTKSKLPTLRLNEKRSKTKPNNKDDLNKYKKYETNYQSNKNKNNFLSNTFNINNTKISRNSDMIQQRRDTNNYNLARHSLIYPFNIEDRDFYIKNHNLNSSFNNITEEGKVIEQQLINRDKKKLFSDFKKRYKGIMKKNKKHFVDMNVYINGKKGKKNSTTDNLLNKYKIIKIQAVLKQIKRKIKKINHKERMKDIIEDVKQFQEKEKITRDKFDKTDELFNNLILDSHLITKRILKKINTEYPDN